MPSLMGAREAIEEGYMQKRQRRGQQTETEQRTQIQKSFHNTTLVWSCLLPPLGHCRHLLTTAS